MNNNTAEQNAVAGISPSDYELPSTHVVQALKERYIHTHILMETLNELWPHNWALDVSKALAELEMLARSWR
jgi:hypothetical protein